MAADPIAPVSMYRTEEGLGVWEHRGKVAAVGVGHSLTERRWDGTPENSLGAWSIVDAHDGDERYVVLRTAQGESPPHLGGYRVPAQIELCHGDRFSARRDGPATLAVP